MRNGDFWNDGALIWTNGFCPFFAEALQQRFGGKIFAILDSVDYADDSFLYHCYCVINGKAFDAKGETSIEKASDLSDMPPLKEGYWEWREVSLDYMEYIHEDYSANDPEMIDEAWDYIARHSHLFSNAPLVKEEMA